MVNVLALIQAASAATAEPNGLFSGSARMSAAKTMTIASPQSSSHASQVCDPVGYVPRRPEEDVAQPRPHQLGRRPVGDVGPVELVEVGAPTVLAGVRGDALAARGCPSQCRARSRSRLSLPPSSASSRSLSSSIRPLSRWYTASANSRMVCSGLCSPMPWTMTTACLATRALDSFEASSALS